MEEKRVGCRGGGGGWGEGVGSVMVGGGGGGGLGERIREESATDRALGRDREREIHVCVECM